MSSIRRAAGFSLRDRLRRMVIQRKLILNCISSVSKGADVIWASDLDACWTCPFQGLPGTHNWKDIPWYTRNSLERLYTVSHVVWD